MKNKGLLIVIFAIGGIGLAAVAARHFTLTERTSARTSNEGKREEGKENHPEEEKFVRLHKDEIKEFGIEIRQAASGKLIVPLELPGEIVLNPDRLVHIVAKVPGVVRHVYKNRGDTVRAGEVLAVIDSRELADAKAAYLAALKRVDIARTNLVREEELWKKRVSPEMDYLEAKKTLAEREIELKSAEQKLHALDLSEEAVSKLPSQADVSYTHYEISAPLSGTVIEKHIATGEMIKDDKEAFLIADLSSVWVNIQVYQKDMLRVRKGQQVVISVGSSIPDATGTIAFIESVANTETRTAIAHVVLPNPNGVLRPGLFVTAKLTVDEIPVSILIPKTALITGENKTEVFVEGAEGFKLQPVTIGRGNDTQVEVVSGLKAGQKYVSQGGFTLKAQIAKGAFGNGHGH